MPSAFSYSKRDLDLYPGRVLPLEKIAQKSIIIHNDPNLAGVSIYVNGWIQGISIGISTIQLNSWGFIYCHSEETTKGRTAELGCNQIYEFQPNPEVEQRVCPWKVTLPPKR